MGPRYAALTSTIPVEPFSPPFHLTFHGSLFERLPLIKELLSLCESKINLNPPIDKVKLDRNQCISPLFHFADEAFDLFFMKEEFPRPQWIVIQSVGLGIRADMSIDQEDLASFDIAVTIPQVDPSLPQGFNLRTKQGDPGLVRFFDKVVMKCLSVLTNQLFTHLSKPRIEHSIKRTAITKSNSYANAKNTFLTVYIYFSGKTDLNQRIPLL
jgi:hypothetical protein